MSREDPANRDQDSLSADTLTHTSMGSVLSRSNRFLTSTWLWPLPKVRLIIGSYLVWLLVNARSRRRRLFLFAASLASIELFNRLREAARARKRQEWSESDRRHLASCRHCHRRLQWRGGGGSLLSASSDDLAAKHALSDRASHVNLHAIVSRKTARARGRPSICFQGAGCALVYHLGVAAYLQQHFDLTHVRFLGASGGALAAVCLALNIDMDFAMESNIIVAQRCRKPPLGPFFRLLQEVEREFWPALPATDEEVARLCDGRLFISLTQVPFLLNRVVAHYATRQALIDAMLSSLNLPIFFFPLRRIDGDLYIDGGISNNHPTIDDDNTTVLCTPFRKPEHARPGCVHISSATAPSWRDFLVPMDRAGMRALGRTGYEDTRRQHEALVARGFVPLAEGGAGGRPRFRCAHHERAASGFFRGLADGKWKKEHHS